MNQDIIFRSYTIIFFKTLYSIFIWSISFNAKLKLFIIEQIQKMLMIKFNGTFLLREPQMQVRVLKEKFLCYIKYYINRRMLGRCDKKPAKKVNGRSNSKSRISLTRKSPATKVERKVKISVGAVLREKYISRQAKSTYFTQIHRLVQNRQKALTELKYVISTRQYFQQISLNPTAILREAAKGEEERKLFEYPHIVSEFRIDDILYAYHKSKQYLHCFRHQCKQPNRMTKNLGTPILSTDYDDSDMCLKTLLNKIDSMIKNSHKKIRRESQIWGEIKEFKFCKDDEISIIFQNSNCKVSQISHEKVKFQISVEEVEKKITRKKSKKSVNRIKSISRLGGETMPVKFLKPSTVNEYGFRNYPKPEFKKANENLRSRNQCSRSTRKFSRSCVSSEGSKRQSLLRKKRQKTTSTKKQEIKFRKRSEYGQGANKKVVSHKNQAKSTNLLLRK